MSKGFITLSQMQSYKIAVKLYIHLAKVTKKISKVNIEQITSEVDIKSIIKGSLTSQENLYIYTEFFPWGIINILITLCTHYLVLPS